VSVNVVGDSTAVMGSMKSELEELRAQLATGGAQAERKLQVRPQLSMKPKRACR
jgi:hypothetical protein